MIIKIIGSLFIIISSSCVGFFMAQKNKYRIEELEELKKGISFYKGSVNSMGYTVEEAFYQASEKTKYGVSKIFKLAGDICSQKKASSVEEIWKYAVNRSFENTYFDKTDINTVYSFGLAAGFMGRQEQSENMDIIIKEIETIQKELRQKSASEVRMYPSMGVFTGLILSVVLF